MALVKILERITMTRNVVHDEVTATFTVFKSDSGDKVLQIDTYGSRSRQMPGKKSQSVQFGPEGISQLREILRGI